MDLLEKHLDRLSFEQKKLLLKTYGKLRKQTRQLHLLRSLIKSHPKNTYVLTSLGNVLWTMGGEKNRLEAIDSFKKALKVNPQYLFAYHGLIRVFTKDLNKRSDHRYELKEIYKRMIKVQPKSEYYRQLCYLSWMDSFWRDIKKYCAEAKKREPRVADNHIYFALALINSSENAGSSSLSGLRKGLGILKQTIVHFPKSELALITYGNQLQKNQNHVLAKGIFTKATQTHPSSLEAWVGLSKAHLVLKEYDQSLRTSLRACRIHLEKGRLAIKNLIYTLSQAQRNSEEKKWISKFYQISDKCLNVSH